MPIKRVITKKRASLLAAAAAASLAGGIAGVQPAVAATATSAAVAHATLTAASSSTCDPKTDFEELDTHSFLVWSNYCGTGYRYPLDIYEVRDATYPYHRIWLHKGTASWCAWGPNDQTVPAEFNFPDNILISDNTSSC